GREAAERWLGDGQGDGMWPSAVLAGGVHRKRLARPREDGACVRVTPCSTLRAMHGEPPAPPVSSDETQPAPLDVRQLIDDRPLSRFQLAIVVICGAIVFLDGFDAQIMGYVAPALRTEFHVERAALGPALS